MPFLIFDVQVKKQIAPIVLILPDPCIGQRRQNVSTVLPGPTQVQSPCYFFSMYTHRVARELLRTIYVIAAFSCPYQNKSFTHFRHLSRNLTMIPPFPSLNL